jgi:hypothetical protein
MLRSAIKLFKNIKPSHGNFRTLSHYPIDDGLFGLTEEQIAVKRQI